MTVYTEYVSENLRLSLNKRNVNISDVQIIYYFVLVVFAVDCTATELCASFSLVFW